jgi:hypothetical protein
MKSPPRTRFSSQRISPNKEVTFLQVGRGEKLIGHLKKLKGDFWFVFCTDDRVKLETVQTWEDGRDAAWILLSFINDLLYRETPLGPPDHLKDKAPAMIAVATQAVTDLDEFYQDRLLDSGRWPTTKRQES